MITDLRINEKGELEGKVETPQWDETYYTKDDMVAMLTELQLEIKELWDNRYDVWLDNQYYIGKSDTLGEIDEVIQQKIDALKEAVEDGKID